MIQVCSGEACFLSKACTHPQRNPVACTPISHLLTERGHFSHEIFDIIAELQDSNTSLQGLFLQVFSLSTYLRVLIKKDSSRPSQIVSVEGKYTTSHPPEAAAVSSRQSWSRKGLAVLLSSLSTWNVSCLHQMPGHLRPLRLSPLWTSLHAPLAEIQLQMYWQVMLGKVIIFLDSISPSVKWSLGAHWFLRAL